MKKIIFSSTAALCTVVGLSSFKSDAKANVRYFDVPGSIATGSLPGGIQQSQVSYRVNQAPPSDCAGTGKICIVAIDTVNLTATNKSHLLAGPQPFATVATKL